MPDYDPAVEPLFLFIVTPPQSGSTALAKLLCTSPGATLLNSRGEGQWLLPGLAEPDRWRKDKAVDYRSLRAVWLARYQALRRADPALEVVVEKSPPNMVRLQPMLAQFSRHLLLANNRDPFANCASRLYRKHNTDRLSREERLEALDSLVDRWLKISRIIRGLVQEHGMPLLTYEQFCERPETILDVLALPPQVAAGVDLQARIKVKDYALAGLSNKNASQVSLLREEEVALLAERLQGERELLAFFGYSAEPPPARDGASGLPAGATAPAAGGD